MPIPAAQIPSVTALNSFICRLVVKYNERTCGILFIQMYSASAPSGAT